MNQTDADKMVNSYAGADPDRRGEAYLAYAKVLQEFDPSKGKASTLFYTAMKNTLHDHHKKEKRHTGLAPFEDYQPSREPSPEHHARWRQFLDTLSKDGMAVLRLLYDGNESKARIKAMLRAEGWAHKRIALTFGEIQEAMEATL